MINYTTETYETKRGILNFANKTLIFIWNSFFSIKAEISMIII